MSAPSPLTEKSALLPLTDNSSRDRSYNNHLENRHSYASHNSHPSFPQRLLTGGTSDVIRPWAIRGLALLCACSLSVGAHYGREFLGPIKSRLAREIGSSNSDFSIILASYSVNNTWTPLIAGLLASRLGTARTSLLATSLIFGGQCILLLGRYFANIGVMAAGLFTFGLGISPIAVVQETIIVRFFAKANLGIFLSIGLLLGKASGFFSALSSFPLSEINPLMPFIVSTLLSAFSFAINIIYLVAGPWLATGAGIAMEDAEQRRSHIMRKLSTPQIRDHSVRHIRLPASDPDREDDYVTEETRPASPASTVTSFGDSVDIPGGQRALQDPSDAQPLMLSEREAEQVVAKKKHVILNDIVKLGDVFWLYLLFNFLCGSIWSPFTHIAANLFQVRYGYTEADASWTASFLHAGSLVLYPIAGYISDQSRHEFIVYKLALFSSILTLGCYFWLLLPPGMTHSALPGVILFGTATGFATLLLVLMVPRIVPPRYIPTALGAHKSIESAGSTISVTLAGMVLDGAVRARQPAHDENAQYPPTPSFVSAAAVLLGTSPESGSGNKVTPATPAQKQAAWNILAGFFFINFLSVCVILLLWRLDRRRKALIAREAGDVTAACVDGEAAPAAGYLPIPHEDDNEDVKDVETISTHDDDQEGDKRSEVDDPCLAPSFSMEPSTSASHSAAANAAGLQIQRRRSLSVRSNTPLIPHDEPHSRSRSQHTSSAGSGRRPPSTIPHSASTDILEHVLAPSKGAIRRGKIFFAICGAVIVGAWVFYVTTLAQDISRRRD